MYLSSFIHTRRCVEKLLAYRQLWKTVSVALKFFSCKRYNNSTILESFLPTKSCFSLKFHLHSVFTACMDGLSPTFQLVSLLYLRFIISRLHLCHSSYVILSSSTFAPGLLTYFYSSSSHYLIIKFYYLDSLKYVLV